MTFKNHIRLLTAFMLVSTAAASEIEVRISEDGATIGNRHMERVLSTGSGRLTTARIINKRAGTTALPTQCDEFRLRVSQGTDKPDTDIWLTTADFSVQELKAYAPPGTAGGKGVVATLFNAEHKISVTVNYELAPDDFYMHKFLKITSEKPVTIERIDVEALCLPDAEQPYQLKCIYAQGKWSPGLGQPLYTTKSGTFWGMEFPAADNVVEGCRMSCGYLWGRTLKPGEGHISHKAVCGVSDDPAFNQECFFDYINRIRVRPLRLQVQYNSWFDFGAGVDSKKFSDTVAFIHNKLVKERGGKPLRTYVIDDGWQDTGEGVTWTDRAWKVNAKFDPSFKGSFEAVRDAGSTLGLWLSPGCNFGASAMVPRYRAAGFEALDNYMSLAGPKYMDLLEKRMVELTKSGVTYFKLDGLFGHLFTRDFELHGAPYGLPEMPQLGLDGIGTSDKRLNDARYDELKTYYLVAGTERLIEIFASMTEANPDVYIVISNGAWLSPWWLMHIDSCWMIMAGDAAGGADRTGELVYRDGVYHEIVKKENTQFPICAIFNHEPKKTSTGESKETFRNYLYMNMSRGTGFIELYLKTALLQDRDWDVLAEGIQWAHAIFPTFHRARMHGGNPRDKEVYGYTAWIQDQGYISIHNQSDEEREYTFTLDRAFGLIQDSGKFYLSSPIEDSLKGLKSRYSYGDTIRLKLRPKEIRILNFDKTERDWSQLKALQENWVSWVDPDTEEPDFHVPETFGAFKLKAQNDARMARWREADQGLIAAARSLIKRVVPKQADLFAVEGIPADDGKDVFEIESVGGKIVLRGNNPVSVASALNWYLKHYAKCHLSWCGDQLNLPKPLPPVLTKVRLVNPSRYSVYFNYCTLSYSAAWWDWKRWEREIDFMAMNGINMPLGVTGIEGAWYHTLLRMGFTDAEARKYLAGPAYQAWQWMQNIEGYGGPLPKSWIDTHIELGRRILDRERELGMTPIQQGFSGAVPRLLKEKFPDAAMKQQRDWFGFVGTMQLDPADPLFTKMGRIFLEEQQRLFGTSHFYGSDPFHESSPPSTDPEYLKQVGETITALLVGHDPKATWCMQSWSIRKPIATAVPKDRLLVLDLGGRWKTTEAFWGYPFVAGMIHNFGGNTRMFGGLAHLAVNPFREALEAEPNCCGMGLFAEGIEQNPVYYDLAFDLIWRNEGVALEPWLREYARRRYGAPSAAAEETWRLLNDTIYSSANNSSVFAARPAIDIRNADPNYPITMAYDPAKVFKAWQLLLSDADTLKGSAGYRYDVVDVGRQVLGDLAQAVHWEVANAFLDGDPKAFAEASGQFLDLFADADALCGTEPVLSYRRWLRSAQAWATTPEERTLYNFNANMLITHWGGDFVPFIFDYSWREWGGLIGDYYRGRWARFHAMLADRMAKGEGWSEAGLKLSYHRPVLDADPFYKSLYVWEMEWIRADRSFDSNTVGDPVVTALALQAKYEPLAERLFSEAGIKQWNGYKHRVRELHLAEERGRRVYHWTPAIVGAEWREVAFDITSYLEAGSEFELMLARETGGELAIRGIVVEQDGVPVAKDQHDGYTGRNGREDGNKNNVYRFHLQMVVPNAMYTVKATLRMEPSEKSNGAVWLKQAPETDRTEQ